MKRPSAILIGCIALGVLLIVGVGLQGPVRFSGLRWVPDFSPPTPPPRSPLPAQSQATASPSPTASAHESSNLASVLAPILWALAAIAVMVAIFFLIRWLLRRAPRTAPALAESTISVTEPAESEPSPAEPDAPVLRRGFELAIDALQNEREPHDAIVKAWLGLQDAAADSGIRRRNAETPTEFTRRILARAPDDRNSVDTLLRVYLRVRFGDHPAQREDVELVREALQKLAASWKARA